MLKMEGGGEAAGGSGEAKKGMKHPPPALNIAVHPPRSSNASAKPSAKQTQAKANNGEEAPERSKSEPGRTTNGVVDAASPEAPPPRRSKSSGSALSTSTPTVVRKITQRVAAKLPFFSFEFFPPRTREGAVNLMRRVETMGEKGPLWVDVTCSPSNKEDALEICAESIAFAGVDAMLHVTCASHPDKNSLRDYLERARKRGVRNIMALRGDPSNLTPDTPAPPMCFSRASELVRFLRDEFGDAFCVAVAAYPEGNGEDTYQQDLASLEEKVNAGADLAVTQLFFDPSVYPSFVADCRRRGIQVPIIPGLMPIQLYKVFHRTVTHIKCRVPPEIMQALEPIKGDDAAVREYGVKQCVAMAGELVRAGAPGVHFYTLNLERRRG